MSNSVSRSRRAHWLRAVATIAMATLPLSAVRADTLDLVLDAFAKAGVISSDVAKVKPLIQCIVDGGELYACGEQAAKQDNGLLPVSLSDPRIMQVVDVVVAVQNGEWLTVLARGGKYVAGEIACNALPPSGIVKGQACNLIHDVIDKNGQQFGEVYGAIASGDWWGLIKAVTPLFGPEAACAVIPDGPVKDVACGALGKVLQEAYEFAKDLLDLGVKAWETIAQGLGLSGGPHMPQEQYEQLYWKTWYHRGTSQCLAGSTCPGLKELKDNIFSSCVEYFDSHQMTEDNAKHTCNGMEQRFINAVKAYADAMKTAADAFAENKRPFARTWAVEDYGKSTTSSRKAFIVENCMFPMRANFPFPEPIPARCDIFKPGSASLLANPEMYETCVKAEQSKLPSPSAWSHACQRAGQRFQSIFNAEKSSLQDQLPKLVAAGCMTPKGWTGAEGLIFTCGTYESFQACRRVLSPGLEEKRCTLDQAKADQRWAQTIAGVLGAKRCKAVGINVSCTRPWKRDACNSMIKEWSTGLNVKPAVQCRFDNVTAYQALVANATIIVKTLNGAPGSSAANCKSTWDPATITCSDPKVLSQLPDLLPSVKLEQCPPDPNKDGADAPCYGGPIPNVVAVGPVVAQQPPAVASGIDLTADPSPQLIRRGGMNPTQWGGSVSVDAGQALSVLDGKCYFGLHFELRNLGTVASPPFEFTLGAQGAEPSMRRSGPLAAGATSSQDMFAYLPSGTSVLRLTVDSAKQVLESNEQNNALEVTVNVSGSCGGRSITR